MDKLLKCEANYVPLSPVTFLHRASAVYSDRTSIIYAGTRFTWNQTYERCRRLASSLRSLNVSKNDVVSVLAPNVPALYEMHFAVPMAGAVLNTVNTRLDANTVSTILRHSEAKMVFVDYQFVPLMRDALRLLLLAESNNGGTGAGAAFPFVVVIDDVDKPTGIRLGELEYEELVRSGDPNFLPCQIDDEWDPITLNYTSGTTSAPKGVVYSHRGAYLSTLSLILQWEMKSEPVYLWSLPMFHCNGWTFTWGVAARGGTNVCIRNTSAAEMYSAISQHKVTHMCCAPIVFNLILNAKPNERLQIHSTVEVLTGGAPPPPTLVQEIEKIGFHVTHAYGLTEATGPALVCEWQEQWNHLPSESQGRLKARQGVGVLSLADVDVKDLQTMASMPRDGQSVGEIVLRGSSIMKGYFKDPSATSDAFKGGWFRTGDVGVIHPDGYLEIKDRSKDVIISGGENISSTEVEAVLFSHPHVLEAAVVAMPHQLWGETPCAFVALKEESPAITEEMIFSYCRENMARFMVPKKVVFIEELPKTATGKVQKFQLRAIAKNLANPEAPKTPRNQSQRSYGNNNKSKKDQNFVQEQVLAISRL